MIDIGDVIVVNITGIYPRHRRRQRLGCIVCHGTGMEAAATPLHLPVPCPACNGRGYIVAKMPPQPKRDSVTQWRFSTKQSG